MNDQNHSQPIFNAIPPAVAALALAILAVELLFWLGSKGIIGGQQAIGWRLEAIQEFGFFPAVLNWVKPAALS